MKKALRIVLPIILVLTIILCSVWYLFVYDRQFTRDTILTLARQSESNGNHKVAAWLYQLAYSQSSDNDSVAIELANQYKRNGNYTKAEYTLTNAIADGGGIDLYIALSKTFVEQDKLLDAVTMLNNITNLDIKEQLDSMRPAKPISDPDHKPVYNRYISVSLQSNSGKIYFTSDGTYPSVSNASYSEPIALSNGKTLIQAIAVADNGLVSPLHSVEYKIGGVDEAVTFKDAAIEAAVREELSIETDTIFTSELWTITGFTVSSDASDLSDLGHMVFLETLTINQSNADDFSFITSLENLKELTITDTNISQTSLKLIGQLPNLERLTISNCNIASLAPLAETTTLIYLDASSNTIRNIDALKNLVNLTELKLQHNNAISDISILSDLKALTKLDISYNTVSTLSPIRSLTSLTWINAGNNQISELGEINNLSKLTYLAINNNQITNVSVLSLCPTIVELDISNNAITDISELSKLVNMEVFNFANNQVTEIPKFPKDCQLVKIDGSNNAISKLDALSGLKALNIVNMKDNANISTIQPLESCNLLIEVNVENTKVRDVKSLTEQSIIVKYNPV